MQNNLHSKNQQNIDLLFPEFSSEHKNAIMTFCVLNRAKTVQQRTMTYANNDQINAKT